MATQREIKRRIKSAKNIGQVTSALEMISAVKMRKAQAAAKASQPYSEILRKVIYELRIMNNEIENSLLRRPEKTESVLLLIVATQKGLVGSMLTNLTKSVIKYVDSNQSKSKFKAVTWGKKAKSIAAKAGIEIIADFSEDKLPLEERVSAVTALLTNEFMKNNFDQISIASTKFINTMTQEPQMIQYLPLLRPSTELKTTKGTAIFKFEPSPERVLDMVLKRYIEQIMNQIVLDSLAAEHSARMIAMKNAHDNASDITKELTLLYNKTRQTSITNEIADIAAASLAN